MENDLPARSFQALIQNMVKIEFYGDKTVTRDILKEKLFEGSSMAAEDRELFIQGVGSILARAGMENWSAAALLKKLAQVQLGEGQA